MTDILNSAGPMGLGATGTGGVGPDGAAASPNAAAGGGGLMQRLAAMNPMQRKLLMSLMQKQMQAPQQPQMTPYQPSAAPAQFGMMPPMRG